MSAKSRTFAPEIEKVMKQIKNRPNCLLCKNSQWKENANNGNRMLICICNRCNNDEKFEREDWRDNVWLEHEFAGMSTEERRAQAVAENQHIYKVHLDIVRERAERAAREAAMNPRMKRARKILDELKAKGQYNGYKLA